MDTQLVTDVPQMRERRSTRAAVVTALGPAAVLAGLVWAVLQPYRVTLLHPHGQGFWWLFVEPPLLVIAVGVAFALLVAPGLLEDLEAVHGSEPDASLRLAPGHGPARQVQPAARAAAGLERSTIRTAGASQPAVSPSLAQGHGENGHGRR
jgi:H+/Cl- antiporter ClcA